MRNITLISTVHDEAGLCNVAKLLQILETARPEVIFLEIPPSFFNQYYKEKDRSNLESKAVNRYLEMRSVELAPVDVYEVPEDFWAKNERLFQKVEAVSTEYKMLMDRNSQHVKRYGFAYLNSKYCIDFWSNLNELMKLELAKIGDEELLRSYEYWKDINEHREQEWMKNIQKYSEEHEFNKGIFLVGSAHRRSIMEKSAHLSLGNSVTLDWNFDNYEDLV
jgi:hypothetical protein